jgi:hypothetical protein
VLQALLGRPDPDAPFTTLSLRAELDAAGHPVGAATIHGVIESLHRAGLIAPC